MNSILLIIFLIILVFVFNYLISRDDKKKQSENIIEKFTTNDSSWQRLNGNIKQISLTQNGDAWGVNLNNKTYYKSLNSSNWVSASGTLIYIEVSGNGKQLFGIGGDNILYWSMANTNGNCNWYKDSLNGQTTTNVNSISSTTDGNTLYITTKDYKIYRWTRTDSQSTGIPRKTGDWKLINGTLKYICVSGDGRHLWGCNSNNNLYFAHANKVNKPDWSLDDRVKLKAVSSSENGQEVWGVDPNGILWKYGKNIWSKESGITNASQIAVSGNSKNVLTCITNGAIFYLNLAKHGKQIYNANDCLTQAKLQYGHKMGSKVQMLQGSYSHVPYGCSVQNVNINNPDTQLYRPHWNTNTNGKNNGDYLQVYEKDARDVYANDLQIQDPFAYRERRDWGNIISGTPSVSFHPDADTFVKYFPECVLPGDSKVSIPEPPEEECDLIEICVDPSSVSKETRQAKKEADRIKKKIPNYSKLVGNKSKNYEPFGKKPLCNRNRTRDCFKDNWKTFIDKGGKTWKLKKASLNPEFFPTDTTNSTGTSSNQIINSKLWNQNKNDELQCTNGICRKGITDNFSHKTYKAKVINSISGLNTPSGFQKRENNNNQKNENSLTYDFWQLIDSPTKTVKKNDKCNIDSVCEQGTECRRTTPNGDSKCLTYGDCDYIREKNDYSSSQVNCKPIWKDPEYIQPITVAQKNCQDNNNCYENVRAIRKPCKDGICGSQFNNNTITTKCNSGVQDYTCCVTDLKYRNISYSELMSLNPTTTEYKIENRDSKRFITEKNKKLNANIKSNILGANDTNEWLWNIIFHPEGAEIKSVQNKLNLMTDSNNQIKLVLNPDLNNTDVRKYALFHIRLVSGNNNLYYITSLNNKILYARKNQSNMSYFGFTDVSNGPLEHMWYIKIKECDPPPHIGGQKYGSLGNWMHWNSGAPQGGNNVIKDNEQLNIFNQMPEAKTVTIQRAQQCKEFCDCDPKCMSWQIISSADAGADGCYNLTKAYGLKYDPWSKHGDNYADYKRIPSECGKADVRTMGDYITSTSGVTSCECKELCENLSTCNSWRYQKTNKNCYTLTSKGPFYNTNTGWSGGGKTDYGKAPGVYLSDLDIKCGQPDVRTMGAEIRGSSSTEKNACECEKLCAQNTNCNSWNFNTKNKNCVLRSSKGPFYNTNTGWNSADDPYYGKQESGINSSGVKVPIKTQVVSNVMQGYFFIKNPDTNKVVDIQGGLNGTKIYLYPQKSSGYENQLWKYNFQTSQIYNPYNNKVLDKANSSSSSWYKNHCILNTSSNGQNQKFIYDFPSQKIINPDTGYVLDNSGNDYLYFNSNSHGGPNQKFIIEPLDGAPP